VNRSDRVPTTPQKPTGARGEIVPGGLLTNPRQMPTSSSMSEMKAQEKSAYEKWAEEKMKWWEDEHKRLNTFLSKLEDDWSKQREDSLRELEEEISRIKHESLLNKKLSGTLTGFDNVSK
jgi:hypothetical protein